MNDVLNHSMFGLCLSNLQDGCPRVITEVLMSGTPLIMSNLTKYNFEVNEAIKDELSFDTIVKKNIDQWLTVFHKL